MKHLRVAIFILAIIGITAPVEAANRVALIIGNSDYKFTPALRNPRNDAKIMTEKLTGLGFDVVSGLDLTHRGMLKAVKDFEAKLKGAKVGMFFYAGHGLQIDGENYLIPTDARPQDKESVKQQSLSLSDVLRVLEFGTETNLVFLDACRDNPLARSLSRSSTGASRSVGTGLAAVEVGKGTLITYSTQPGNVAADGVGLNSPFTKALAKWIGEPGLEARQMLTRVRKDVLAETYGQQVPWDHSSLTGDFYFGDPGTPGSNPRLASKPALPDLTQGQMAALQRMLSGGIIQAPIKIDKGKWKVKTHLEFEMCSEYNYDETYEIMIDEKPDIKYYNDAFSGTFSRPIARFTTKLDDELTFKYSISGEGTAIAKASVRSFVPGDVIKFSSQDGLSFPRDGIDCGIMNVTLNVVEKL